MAIQLPTHISNDGHEVFDWAARFSDHIHKLDRKHELATAIATADTTCGSCDHWMTDACPREVHDNRKGHKVGPSCNAPKCGKHSLKSWDAKRIEGLKAELAQIETELTRSE